MSLWSVKMPREKSCCLTMPARPFQICNSLMCCGSSNKRLSIETFYAAHHQCDTLCNFNHAVYRKLWTRYLLYLWQRWDENVAMDLGGKQRLGKGRKKNVGLYNRCLGWILRNQLPCSLWFLQGWDGKERKCLLLWYDISRNVNIKKIRNDLMFPPVYFGIKHWEQILYMCRYAGECHKVNHLDFHTIVYKLGLWDMEGQRFSLCTTDG